MDSKKKQLTLFDLEEEKETVKKKQLTPKKPKKKPLRAYNKSIKIKRLFDELHDEHETKISTFRLIADELKLSLIAIKKAYYREIKKN